MVTLTKRKKEFGKFFKRDTVYSLSEAIEALDKFPKVKFDESVELHFALNVDPKNSEQMLRGTVVLPHGTGKKVRILAFCKGENVKVAEQCGVEFCGSDELIDKVSKGFLDFDCVVATPDMMRDVSKLGKILGPRGMMPSPKAGTVSQDIEKIVKELRAGRVEFKSDKQAGIHVMVGKRSFPSEQLFKNAQTIIDSINNAKPASVKGILIRNAYLSTSMGPGLRLSI